MNTKPIHYLIITSILLVLSEALIHLSGVKNGIIAYITVLIFLIILFTLTKNLSEEYTRVFQIITLIPLYRIITLTIPIELITYEGYLISTTIAILAGSLVLIHHLKIPLADIGLILKDPKLQILCITAGGVIGYLEWKIINPQQLGSLMPSVLILTLCAFTDELIFRGLIQQSIEKAQESSFIAIFLTSILYTTFFISFPFSLNLLLIFLVSVFYGYVVSKSKSIIGVSISHALVNICCLVFIPYFS
ncbi:MAG: CPBP family intramembrane glutamic endopeptidase [Methanosarcinales archaeon]